jgi:hypothetical protein
MRLIVANALTILFALTSCNKKEEASIDALREQIINLGISRDIKEMSALGEDDAAAIFNIIGKINDNFSQLKTAGLPDDLKTAIQTVQKAFSDMENTMSSGPIPIDILIGGEAKMAEWLADPSFAAKIMPEITRWAEEMGDWEERSEQVDKLTNPVFIKYKIPLGLE